MLYSFLIFLIIINTCEYIYLYISFNNKVLFFFLIYKSYIINKYQFENKSNESDDSYIESVLNDFTVIDDDDDLFSFVKLLLYF